MLLLYRSVFFVFFLIQLSPSVPNLHRYDLFSVSNNVIKSLFHLKG